MTNASAAFSCGLMANTVTCLFLLLSCCLSFADHRDPPPSLSPMDFLHAVHSGGPHRSASNHSRSPAAGISLLSDKVEEEEKEEEDDAEINLSSGHDCRTAKSAAESSRRNNPSAKTYIPSCSADGRYQEIQCYEDFCWCVDTDKGIPMKGSGSSRNASLPDCSRKKAVSRARDCHMEQKLHFLKLLTALFRQQMIQAKNSRHAIRRSRSKAKILRWKFDHLDLDRNSVLDNREWKLFKQSLKGSKKRRSRDSAPYNDKNFKSEWLECTGSSIDTDDGDSLLSVSSLAASHFRGRRQPVRQGPNPFATLLKD